MLSSSRPQNIRFVRMEKAEKPRKVSVHATPEAAKNRAGACPKTRPLQDGLIPRQTGSAAKARYSGPDRGPRPAGCSCRHVRTSGRTPRGLVPHWETDRIATECFPPT